MKEYTIEMIKEEMHGIKEEDLQRRLKGFYKEKEKIFETLKREEVNKEIIEELNVLKNNIDLHIEVYEKELPIRVVERAKRSAGLYINAEEYANSIKREAEDIKAHEKDER